jgi:superfamily II DNA or RNA helicase
MKFLYDKKNEELILQESTRTEFHQLEIWLTRYVKGYKYMMPFKLGVWNGKNSYFRNGKVNLGLWRECLKAANEISSTFSIINREDFPVNRDITLESVRDFCQHFFKSHKIKNKSGELIDFYPYDHQIETAYKILKNRYCLAEVATSGGKSLIISIVYFYILSRVKNDAKLLIIVPSITLVTQFFDSIVDFNRGIDGDNPNKLDLSIEEIMSEKPRKWGKENPDIWIGTYQSLEKWDKDFFKKFYVVACDEAHSAKNKTISTILKRTFGRAEYRFGVSGTFPVDDSAEILAIQSLIGPKIAEVTAEELKNKGIITKMEIKSLILNHGDSDFNERLNYIRKAGMGKEALELEKDYIHLSTKRMDMIKKIINKCDKNTLMLFFTIEYGQKLLSELSSEFKDKEFYYIDGSISGKKRDEIKSLLEEKSDKVRILIASFGTLAVGVSVNNLHYLILADSFKSEQVVIQSIGRLLRLHGDKEKAIIFDLVDVFVGDKPTNILWRHYLERVNFYIKRKYPYKEIKLNL